MYCTECGKENSPCSKFCFNCGNSLVQSNSVESKLRRIIKSGQKKIEQGVKFAEEKEIKKSLLKFGRKMQRGFEKVPIIQFRASPLDALQENLKNRKQRENYPKWIHANRLLAFIASTESAKNFNSTPEGKQEYANLHKGYDLGKLVIDGFSQDPSPYLKKIENYIQKLIQYDPTFAKIFTKWVRQLHERLEIVDKIRSGKDFKNHELLYTKREREKLNTFFEEWAYSIEIGIFQNDSFYEKLLIGMKNDSKIFYIKK